ncbi:hypothetical protein [Streptomyces sp. LN704]
MGESALDDLGSTATTKPSRTAPEATIGFMPRGLTAESAPRGSVT